MWASAMARHLREQRLGAGGEPYLVVGGGEFELGCHHIRIWLLPGWVLLCRSMQADSSANRPRSQMVATLRAGRG